MQVNPFWLGKQVKDKEQREKKSPWKTLTTSPDKRKAFAVNRKRGCAMEVAISASKLFHRTQTDTGRSAGFPWCDVRSIAHYQVSRGSWTSSVMLTRREVQCQGAALQRLPPEGLAQVSVAHSLKHTHNSSWDYQVAAAPHIQSHKRRGGRSATG